MEAKACRRTLWFPSDIRLDRIGGKRIAFVTLNQKGRAANRTVRNASLSDLQWRRVRIDHRIRPLVGLSHSGKDSHGKFGWF